MKKFISILITLFFAEVFFAQNSADVANRATALRCLKVAESCLVGNDFQTANSQAEMGLSYDDSISDLFYVKAAAGLKLGNSKAEVIKLLYEAFEKNNWVEYMETGTYGRILVVACIVAYDPGISQVIQLLKKIADICELRAAPYKALVNDFGRYGKADKDILIPQVQYYTNDSWEVISAGRPLTGGESGWPILHRGLYSKGNLYVLTIPEDFANLYDYPAGVLNEIRRLMSQDLDLYMEGPSRVGVFVYDNKTVIVENFNDTPVDIKLVGKNLKSLTDLENGEEIAATVAKPAPGGFFFGPRVAPSPKAAVTLPPHSYRAFKYE